MRPSAAPEEGYLDRPDGIDTSIQGYFRLPNPAFRTNEACRDPRFLQGLGLEEIKSIESDGQGGAQRRCRHTRRKTDRARHKLRQISFWPVEGFRSEDQTGPAWNDLTGAASVSSDR